MARGFSGFTDTTGRNSTMETIDSGSSSSSSSSEEEEEEDTARESLDRTKQGRPTSAREG